MTIEGQNCNAIVDFTELHLSTLLLLSSSITIHTHVDAVVIFYLNINKFIVERIYLRNKNSIYYIKSIYISKTMHHSIYTHTLKMAK